MRSDQCNSVHIQRKSGQFKATCADAEDDADDDSGNANATTHVGAHPRPLDVLMPFFPLFVCM